MHTQGAAANQQGTQVQQAPMHQQGIHQPNFQPGSMYGFVAPQALQSVSQVHPFNNAANALNLTAQQSIHQQNVNQQGADQEATNQGIGGVPIVLTQQEVQKRLMDRQRIANACGSMFAPFQVPTVNPTQAPPDTQHQQHQQSAIAALRPVALQQGADADGNGETAKRGRALNMWIAFRCKQRSISITYSGADSLSHQATILRSSPAFSRKKLRHTSRFSGTMTHSRRSGPSWLKPTL
jgi:hypothetical protein